LFFAGIVVILVIFVVVVVDVVDVVHLIFSSHPFISFHLSLFFSPGWRLLLSHPYHHDEELWSICDSERESDAG